MYFSISEEYESIFAEDYSTIPFPSYWSPIQQTVPPLMEIDPSRIQHYIPLRNYQSRHITDYSSTRYRHNRVRQNSIPLNYGSNVSQNNHETLQQNNVHIELSSDSDDDDVGETVSNSLEPSNALRSGERRLPKRITGSTYEKHLSNNGSSSLQSNRNENNRTNSSPVVNSVLNNTYNNSR